MNCRSTFLPVVGTLLGAALATAQAPKTIALKPPDAMLAEEFSWLRSARELPDGRLLVTDIIDNRVAIADWTTSRVTTVGGKGEGPGEYQHPDWLAPLANDSTLLLDTTTRRWFVLVGSRIVETIPAHLPASRNFTFDFRGADRSGHVLAQTRNLELQYRRMDEMQAGTSSATVDSLVLVIGNRSGGRVDTVAHLRSASRRQTKAFPKGANHDVTWILENPLDVGEQALLFPDGWIAVARMAPYRVDWRQPNGTWIRGARVAEPVVRVDDRIKRAAIARKFPNLSDPPFDPAAYPEWPATLPPFGTDMPMLFALADGRLVVRRTPATDDANRYDVVDRTGTRVASFSLPSNQTVLTFGTRSVYIVVRDDDGIQRLHRHPWP